MYERKSNQRTMGGDSEKWSVWTWVYVCMCVTKEVRLSWATRKGIISCVVFYSQTQESNVTRDTLVLDDKNRQIKVVDRGYGPMFIRRFYTY